MDLDWNRAEEFLEERGGFRELGGRSGRQHLHFGGEPPYDEPPGTEEHHSIEVDDRQGISFTEPILLA
jgi:hypothetical protein